jgi:hypothetical protein
MDGWKAEVCVRVWVEQNDILVIDEAARHQEIEKKAYELWERAGRPDGDPDSFWYGAEVIVDSALFD